MRRALLAVLWCLALCPSVAAAAPSFTSSNGLTVQNVKQIDPRLFDVTVASTAVDGPLHVRVILPDGYDQHAGTRYPVLYLIHGTSGGASDWTDKGDAEKTTAGRRLITVIPDEGVNFDGGGYCTDWFNRGAGGKPMWETFHIGQVVPWIDRSLRTRATRAGREIFGLSQGAFCSFTYATRHPDMFLGAGSFSGAIDSAKDDEAKALMTPIVQGTATGLDGSSDPDAMFGPRATQELNWAAHDPATLVANMRGMSVYAYTGNGQPGPLDPPAPNPGGSTIESGVHTLTTLWKADADAAGVPVDYHDYGPGTHSWPYWARDLREVIGGVARDFAAAAPPPAKTFYTSAEDPWSQWGYHVTITRPAREFSTLSDGDASGFTLAGSGSATVTTPAAYVPRSAAVVRLRGPNVSRTVSATADRSGRLQLAVPLGPGNPFQQSTAEAQAAGGTQVYATRVSITGILAGSRGSGAGSCASRRSITFRSLVPKGWRILSARAKVGGHNRSLRHRRRTATLSLTGLPKGAYRVALALTLHRHGRSLIVRRHRVFRTCTPKRRHRSSHKRASSRRAG
jgi:S-formylglutathione hydrolase FrmB